MGIAAYNRGSRLIRRQADDALVRRDLKPLNWDLERDGYRDKIATLELDLSRARRALKSSRLNRTLDQKRIIELTEELQASRQETARWVGLFYKMRARWVWVSGLVRTYLSPEQVQNYRNDEN